MGNSVYSSNDYIIRAYCNVLNNSNGGATQIYFECFCSDDKTTVDPTWGTDEYVNIEITNYVKIFRPTEVTPGAGVTVSSPSCTTTIGLDSAEVADPLPSN